MPLTPPPQYGGGWDQPIREEMTRCRNRRARVLAFPEIAAKLCEPPLQYAYPEQWNGYVPPAEVGGAGDSPSRGVKNGSIMRLALLAILEETLEAEKRAWRERQEDGPDYGRPPDTYKGRQIEDVDLP